MPNATAEDTAIQPRDWKIELITTGSELMLGYVLNTHPQWLCRKFSDAGYLVQRQIAVSDEAPAIQQAVREALTRADCVITTGGLGPTSDDLTRPLIAKLLKLDLHEDPELVARLQRFFFQRNRPVPPGTLVQAQVPTGAEVLLNANGTAPGLLIELAVNPFAGTPRQSWLVMLPGPPRELYPMFLNQVLPRLQDRMPTRAEVTCHTLKSVGIGESVAEAKIVDELEPLRSQGLEIGYCSRPGEVDLRLRAKGKNGKALVVEAERLIERKIGNHIYGRDGDELETVIVRLLEKSGKTLATAESCTGGLLGSRITDVPGSSAVFRGGWVTYSNDAKQICLGVDPDLLAEHGAVSEPVVRHMAESAQRLLGADYALALSGIAGPSGGTPDKPVGTLFLGLAGPDQTSVSRLLYPYDRALFKHSATQAALEQLRRSLLKLAPSVGPSCSST